MNLKYTGGTKAEIRKALNQHKAEEEYESYLEEIGNKKKVRKGESLSKRITTAE